MVPWPGERPIGAGFRLFTFFALACTTRKARGFMNPPSACYYWDYPTRRPTVFLMRQIGTVLADPFSVFLRHNSPQHATRLRLAGGKGGGDGNRRVVNKGDRSFHVMLHVVLSASDRSFHAMLLGGSKARHTRRQPIDPQSSASGCLHRAKGLCTTEGRRGIATEGRRGITTDGGRGVTPLDGVVAVDVVGYFFLFAVLVLVH